jgi:hypothetical protein
MSCPISITPIVDGFALRKEILYRQLHLIKVPDQLDLISLFLPSSRMRVSQSDSLICPASILSDSF